MDPRHPSGDSTPSIPEVAPKSSAAEIRLAPDPEDNRSNAAVFQRAALGSRAREQPSQSRNGLAYVLVRLLYENVADHEVMPLIRKFPRSEQEIAARVASAVPEQRWHNLHDAMAEVPEHEDILMEIVLMRDEMLTAHTLCVHEPGPVMDPVAFHGPLGEYVRRVEPHTEADRHAILVQLLVLGGNLIGRTAYFRHEADTHHTNLFAVIVGATSEGRKGVSYGRAQQLFAEIDPEWKSRIVSGLSSGEGLIHAVRDPVYGKDSSTGEPMVLDVGVEDKRLLARESEFSSVLKMPRRDGNILSATLRQAWDTGDLQTLTKTSPAKATGAHTSIIAHITPEELRSLLSQTDAVNGFGNRFLWVLSRRSKLLPEGGQLHLVDSKRLLEQFRNAFHFASGLSEMQRDLEARRLWCERYPGLVAGRPGLLGKITSRAAAQISRIEMIFAVFDRSPVRRVEHLEAALAVWRFCEASAEAIFGDALGDRVADQILERLRLVYPEGVTQTELNELFNGHLPGNRLAQALELLLQARLVRYEVEETGGRPARRWFALEGAKYAQ